MFSPPPFRPVIVGAGPDLVRLPGGELRDGEPAQQRWRRGPRTARTQSPPPRPRHTALRAYHPGQADRRWRKVTTYRYFLSQSKELTKGPLWLVQHFPLSALIIQVKRIADGER